MSVPLEEYATLNEEKIDRSYEQIVLERVMEDGPVSASQIAEDLENELRYADNDVDPDRVNFRDIKGINDIFKELRERNKADDLENELSVSYPDGEMHLRFMDDQELLRYEPVDGAYRAD